MNRLEMPVNISLMDTHSERIKNFPKITVLDTFDGFSTTSFHPEGLFSAEIFGRVGTPDRDRRFAFIHTKIAVINPFIFKKLVKLKGLYQEIIFAKRYAVWNAELKDFEPSDIINGETGFSFFMKHVRDIEFKLTESITREKNVELVKKALADGTFFIVAVPVIPAGLRDAYIEADGRVTEDEINPLYRSILSATRSLPDAIEPGDDENFNTTRVSIQNGVNKVFEHIWNLYKGKNGFGQQHYYSRRVFNATRNVITAMNTAKRTLGSEHGCNPNNTDVGLFQALKGLMPKVQYFMTTGFMARVFSAGDGRAYLTNRKTRTMEMVTVNRKVYDRFTTPEGIEKCVNAFFNRELRAKPVIVDGYYLGLVYRGEHNGKKVFKFFNDINDLPKGFSVSDVHPITWVELFYVCGYRHWYNFPCTNTRYPVAGLGSTYISKAYVKTTVVGEQRWELGDDWEILTFNDGNPVSYAYEYPDLSYTKYMETISVHPGRISGLGADYDGD